jgi:hypothetical protein
VKKSIKEFKKQEYKVQAFKFQVFRPCIVARLLITERLDSCSLFLILVACFLEFIQLLLPDENFDGMPWQYLQEPFGRRHYEAQD